MIAIVTGGRFYRRFIKDDFDFLDSLNITTLVNTGAYSGVDLYAREWAAQKFIPTLLIYAKLDHRNQELLNTMRNYQMITNSAAKRCVLFPGGEETKNMEKMAFDFGLEIIKKEKS